MTVNPKLISTLLESVDVLRHLIETSTSPKETNQARVEAMIAALRQSTDAAELSDRDRDFINTRILTL